MVWKLYLDDIRNPKAKGWTIARSYDEAIVLILEKGFPDAISFDHDLGENAKTGKDLANWIVEYDLDTGLIPKEFKYFVHSANPVGSKNIVSLLSSYLASRNN